VGTPLDAVLAAGAGHLADIRLHAVEVDAQNGRIEIAFLGADKRLRHNAVL
jgi:hypothetical protein